jgi:hypothetical protein
MPPHKELERQVQLRMLRLGRPQTKGLRPFVREPFKPSEQPAALSAAVGDVLGTRSLPTRGIISIADFLLPHRVFAEDVWDIVEAHDERVTLGMGRLSAALWLLCQVAWVAFACIRNPPKVGERSKRSS